MESEEQQRRTHCWKFKKVKKGVEKSKSNGNVMDRKVNGQNSNEET